jgi:ribosomal protein L17
MVGLKGLENKQFCAILSLLKNMAFSLITKSAIKGTLNKAEARLEELGIVREITSKRRDKLYSYEKYMLLLNEGTEPIKS